MKNILKLSLFLLLTIGINKSYAQYQAKKDSLLVLKNGFIINLTPEGAVIKKGTIVIEKDCIKEVKMLYSGITTVRDMAGNAIILSDYARASNLNQIPAPSIFYASQFAGPKYFNEIRSYSTYTGSKNDTPWAQSITDSTNIPLAIARAKGVGVTGIKIYANLKPSLVAKIVKEAKKQGLQSWSHGYYN